MNMKCDYNSILDVKKQGIVFNPEFERWEVYGDDPVIRAGEPQPEFVSTEYDKCITYRMTVEGEK